MTARAGLRAVLDALRARPGLSAGLLAGLVLAGLAEGFGMAAFLPLLSLAEAGGGEAGGLAEIVLGALDRLGLARAIGPLLLLIVIAMTARIVLVQGAMTAAALAQARIAAALRRRLVDGVINARFGYFVDQPIGGHANAIGVETDRAAGAYTLAVQMAASAAQVLAYLVVALLIDWRVTLAAAVLGGAIAAALGPLLGIMRRQGAELAHAYRRVGALLMETLQGIKTLKAMASEGRLGRLLEAEIARLSGVLARYAVIESSLRAAQEWLLVVAIGLGIALASGTLDLSLATIVLGAALFYRAVGRMNTLQAALAALVHNQAFQADLVARLNELGAARETARAEAPPRFSHALVLEDVHAAHGPRAVLEGVALQIPFGAFVVITGLSGAGKTTLADLILGFLEPTRGRVLIDGRPLARLDARAWRAQVGFIAQDAWLLNDTVRVNVTLGDPAIDDDAVWAALAEADAEAFARRMAGGLDALVGERGGRLSGGERQRLALARALVRKPRLLVLDEPTSALDHEAEAAIGRTLVAQRGKTTILAIAHRPALAALADRVVRLESGRLSEERPRAPQA
jgi:ATP-binding cassette subfamily C protein